MLPEETLFFSYALNCGVQLNLSLVIVYVLPFIVEYLVSLKC